MKKIYFIVGLVLLFFVSGCAQTKTPSMLLYQAVGTDTVAVSTTTALYQAGNVSFADALAVQKGAIATQSALKAWQAVIAANGDQTQIATLVSQDIATLLAQ